MVCGPAFDHGGSLLRTHALLSLSCSGILHTGFGGLGPGRTLRVQKLSVCAHLAVPRPSPRLCHAPLCLGKGRFLWP